jgi:hypothetical protein
MYGGKKDERWLTDDLDGLLMNLREEKKTKEAETKEIRVYDCYLVIGDGKE